MKTITKGLLTGLLGLTASVALAGPAFAGPPQVSQNNGTLNGNITRFYDNPGEAKAGHDGWCSRGRDHKNNFACTVDTSNDHRSLSIQFWNGALRTAGGTATVRPFPPSGNPNQLPLCRQRANLDGLGYHADSNSEDIYICGFWS